MDRPGIAECVAPPAPLGRDSVGAVAESGSMRTSSAFGRTAVTSSRNPARAGSRTQTRR